MLLGHCHSEHVRLLQTPGGEGVVAPKFGTDCEKDPESGGGDK